MISLSCEWDTWNTTSEDNTSWQGLWICLYFACKVNSVILKLSEWYNSEQRTGCMFEIQYNPSGTKTLIRLTSLDKCQYLRIIHIIMIAVIFSPVWYRAIGTRTYKINVHCHDLCWQSVRNHRIIVYKCLPR